MKIVLTGGVASGKSSVCKIMKDIGFVIIDGDTVAKKLQSDDTLIRERIKKEIGKQFVTDEGLDRPTLREAAFSDQSILATLNDIMLQGIYDKMQDVLNKVKDADIVFDVPLWFDTPYRLKGIDEVWTVIAPMNMRLERLKHRDNANNELAEKMIRSQVDDATRVDQSDRIIDNSGSFEDLERRVRQVLRAAEMEKLDPKGN